MSESLTTSNGSNLRVEQGNAVKTKNIINEWKK
jgi:hypothetical protein